MQDQLIQQIFTNYDNFLQESFQKTELQSLDMVVWLKAVKKLNFPKAIQTYLHLVRDNQLLLTYPSSNRLQGILINTDQMEIEEKFTFSLDDQRMYLDFNFFHSSAFLINDRIFYFQNYNRQEQQHVLIADLTTQRLYPIVNVQTKPHGFRMQYSVNLISDYKFYMFGGVDDQLNLLNYLECFNIIRCEWELVQTKGHPPTPRHSHLSFTYQSYLFILGGSTSHSPFERDEGQLHDCHSLDLNTMSWASVHMVGSIPKILCYGHLAQVSSRRFLYLHEDHFFLWSVDQLVIHDPFKVEWLTVKHPRAHMVTPEFRYRSSVHFNSHKNQIYVYGGFSFTKVEPQSIITTMDVLQLLTERDSKNIENFEVFNGEKLHDIKAVMKDKKPEKQGKQKQFLDEADSSFAFADPEEDEEELTFEELLEREKKLQQQEEDEKLKQPTQKKKKQLQKKKKKSGK